MKLTKTKFKNLRKNLIYIFISVLAVVFYKIPEYGSKVDEEKGIQKEEKEYADDFLSHY